MQRRSEHTIMTLANVIALAADIADESSSPEFPDILGGSVMARATTDMLVASQINQRIIRQQYHLATRSA
jgi:hypothetical protein